MNKENFILMLGCLIVSGIILNYSNEDWVCPARVVFMFFLLGTIYYAVARKRR